MDEILKTVLRSNKERRLLTDNSVKKICRLSTSNGVAINDIRVFPSNFTDVNCAAIYFDGNICFFRDSVEALIDKCYTNFIDQYNLDGNKIDIYNYFYLCIIFHELAHVHQHYIMDKKKNKLESKVFSLCSQLADNREFYEDNYYNFLTEINANNIASMKAFNLYRNLPSEFITKNDLVAYNTIMIKEMLRDNYELFLKKEIVISPFEKLLMAASESIQGFDISNYKNIMDDSSKITLYRKLMLGLPISYLEFAYVNLYYELLRGGEDVNVIKKLQKKIV